MGLFDFFKKKPQTSFTVPVNRKTPAVPIIDQKLSYVEKEQILVNHIVTADMLQFPKIKYNLNLPIKKFSGPYAHPIAYIDLDSYNQSIAIHDLDIINDHIIHAQKYIDLLASNVFIKTEDIVFHKYDPGYGYTHLLCYPYTVKGTISKLPLRLFFATRLNVHTYSAHGNIDYNEEGDIFSAEVFIWRGHLGWFFYFTTIDGNFLLQKAESTLRPDKDGRPGIVYRDKSLIEAEASRLKEEQDFQWLQETLPAKCPKSLGGFRRMKTQNTKNYQALKQLAADLGREI